MTFAAAATVYAPTYVLTGAPTIHACVRTIRLTAITAAALLSARNRSKSLAPATTTRLPAEEAALPRTG